MLRELSAAVSGSIGFAPSGGKTGGLTPDGSLNVTLGNPLDPAAPKGGPNPETLFAAAYSACYLSAVQNTAKKMGASAKDAAIHARASLQEDDAGGFHLAVELHGELPGIEKAHAQRIMEEAHKTCPYSKALRGGAPVKLVVD